MLRKIFYHRALRANRSSDILKHQRSIDYGSDSLRFTYDAYLVEYQTVRREIELRLDLQDRTINYMLILVAAVVSASQVFGEEMIRLVTLLSSMPFIYIVIAIATLYFPYSITINNIYIAVLGAYENNVLSPKIDAIARVLSAHSDSTKEFFMWEKENFPVWLNGTFRWDDYRARTMFTGFSAFLMGILATFGTIFVSLPAILFIGMFLYVKLISPKSPWQPIEYLLLLFFFIIVLAIIGGIIFGNKVYLGIAHIERGTKREPLFQ